MCRILAGRERSDIVINTPSDALQFFRRYVLGWDGKSVDHKLNKSYNFDRRSGSTVVAAFPVLNARSAMELLGKLLRNLTALLGLVIRGTYRVAKTGVNAGRKAVKEAKKQVEKKKWCLKILIDSIKLCAKNGVIQFRRMILDNFLIDFMYHCCYSAYKVVNWCTNLLPDNVALLYPNLMVLSCCVSVLYCAFQWRSPHSHIPVILVVWYAYVLYFIVVNCNSRTEIVPA